MLWWSSGVAVGGGVGGCVGLFFRGGWMGGFVGLRPRGLGLGGVWRAVPALCTKSVQDHAQPA